jgi:pantothenate kinase
LHPSSRDGERKGYYHLLDSAGWERTVPLLDLTFLLEIDRAVRLERLIARNEQFGKSAAAARAWVLGPDEANAAVIEATSARANYGIALG